MNYSNEDQPQNNSRALRPFKYNNKNIKVSSRKQKLKSEKSNPEIVEFKSQDNLIFVKNPRPIQNIDHYLEKENSKEQKQFYDSNNNKINKNNYSNNDYIIPQQQNKSNSSVKINTKVKSKKYFGTNTSKKFVNNNGNDYFSNKTNYKEKMNHNNSNNNISSNNFNIIYRGQNSVKINGNKMINHFSNQNINKNNKLAMTKSSIQISGNYPLNQSQNIFNQSKIESMELNIEGQNSSKEKFNMNNNNNEKFNNSNQIKNLKNKYMNNQNYKNKTHLVKKEPINTEMNYNTKSYNDIDNLSPELIENENKILSKKYNNYNWNNLYENDIKLKSNQLESDKNINFTKNSNEYNNIFFYNSNNNTNDINENFSYNEEKNNFHYRDNNIINDDFLEESNCNTVNYINYMKNKSNEISANNIKENKLKNKFVYKKSGNLSEKKLTKINSTKNTSHIKTFDSQNNDQKLIQRINKEKAKLREKKPKNNKDENIITKNKRKNEIKRNKDIHNYSNINKQENKKLKKNIVIKISKIKNKLKNSYDIIDFKLKMPIGKDLEKEEIISINIKEDNISEKIQNIINEYSLDSSYFEPLLSLVNNSINILNNVNNFQISKKIRIQPENNSSLLKEKENLSSFSSSKDISETNYLDYSIIFDLIQKKMYKEYIENIYSDIDEINENSKILNLSI